MQRTAGYVTTLAFADRATADRAVARVRGIHRRVHGIDSVTGLSYSADDPDLLRWVHVTEVSSFASAVRRLGLIDDAEEDRFLAEQVRAGELLGATDLPSSRAEVEDYFAAVRPELVMSPVARRAAMRLAAGSDAAPDRAPHAGAARVDRRRDRRDRHAAPVGEGDVRAAARPGHGRARGRRHHSRAAGAADRPVGSQASHRTPSTTAVIAITTSEATAPTPSARRSACR